MVQLALGVYPITLFVIGFFLRRLVSQIDLISSDHLQMKVDIARLQEQIKTIQNDAGN